MIALAAVSFLQEHEAATQNSNKGETMMKPSTKDKAEGSFHEIKGKVKEKAGQLTNSPGLEARGKGEKTAGRMQKAIGKTEKALRE